MKALLEKLVGPRAGGPGASRFLVAARERGVSARVARTLERAACRIAPEEPERILQSRELFEAAAIRSVLADAGNLELSFRAADRIASVVDDLDLARASDVPDPFRRVWVSDTDGRRRAVVLSHGLDELAVICPRDGERVAPGHLVRVGYRGAQSTVEIELEVTDAVLLPHGLVLHLVRADGSGSIGRSTERYAVHFRGEISAHDPEPGDEGLALPCEVLDFSRGGLRLEGGLTFGRGDRVLVEVPLHDDHSEPLACPGVVRWVKETSPSRRSLGVEFEGMSAPDEARLVRFIRGQALGFTAG